MSENDNDSNIYLNLRRCSMADSLKFVKPAVGWALAQQGMARMQNLLGQGPTYSLNLRRCS